MKASCQCCVATTSKGRRLCSAYMASPRTDTRVRSLSSSICLTAISMSGQTLVYIAVPIEIAASDLKRQIATEAGFGDGVDDWHLLTKAGAVLAGAVSLQNSGLSDNDEVVVVFDRTITGEFAFRELPLFDYGAPMCGCEHCRPPREDVVRVEFSCDQTVQISSRLQLSQYARIFDYVVIEVLLGRSRMDYTKWKLELRERPRSDEEGKGDAVYPTLSDGGRTYSGTLYINPNDPIDRSLVVKELLGSVRVHDVRFLSQRDGRELKRHWAEYEPHPADIGPQNDDWGAEEEVADVFECSEMTSTRDRRGHRAKKSSQHESKSTNSSLVAMAKRARERARPRYEIARIRGIKLGLFH